MLDLDTVTLTPEALAALDLDAAVASSDRPVIDGFDEGLRAKYEALEQSGDKDAATMVKLIALVTTFALREGHPTEPFAPRITFTNGHRTPIVQDLQDGHFDMLAAVLDFVTDPELRARIADVLWQRQRRDVNHAVIAIEAYLDSARRLDDAARWPEPFKRVKRAFELAKQILRGKPEPFDDVEQWMLRRAQELDGNDPLYYSERLMSLLLETERTSEEMRAFAEQSIRTAKQPHPYPERARAYLELAAKWYERLGERNTAKQMRIDAAETIVQNAQSQSQAIAKSALLADAITALRNAGAPADRVAELRKELDDVQRESLSEMKTISAPIDLADMILENRRAALGRSFKEAMLKLAFRFRVPNVAELRAEVEDSMERMPLRVAFSSRRLDRSGRVTGTRAGAFGDAEDREEVVQAEMHETARRQRMIAAEGCVLPFLSGMRLEHRPGIRDLIALVRDRPLVPFGCAEFFARGLYEGYHGDFLVAAHLLVPALEHALRTLLSSRGVITYSHSPAGIQDFLDLGALIEKEELAQVLDSDYVFTLKGLLVSRFGENLRNNLAHGLLLPSETRGYAAVYLWWLTLHLMFAVNIVPDSSSANHNT